MSEEDSEDGDWFEQALSDARQEGESSDDIDSDTSDDDWFEADEPSGDDQPRDSLFGEQLTAEASAEDQDEDSSFGEQLTAEATADDQDEDSLFGEESTAEASADDQDEDSLFEEDFASALASAGPDDEREGAEAEAFDEEDFDTEIPRIDLGIEGLDEMIQGGIPDRHLMVVIGAPGSGKTTFGLQFLNHGLASGENAVFITLEQSRESIFDTADERGWDFERYENNGQLAIVDLDPVEMANSLRNIGGEFPKLVRQFGADRLVLDSVSLLEMMYEDQAKRRTEVFDFTRSLKEAGVTTMLTSEANEDNPYASRYGIIEYLTDAVFILQYIRGDTDETRLAVEIQKIRNANHSRQTKPYAITLDGIDVYQQASIF